jgi:hypothetical protein
MSDDGPTVPLDELATQARQFLEEDPIRLIEPDNIVETIRTPGNQTTDIPHNVSLSQVSTYVVHEPLSKTLQQNIVFPSFASHWAVIVEFQGVTLGYHLAFVDPAAAQLSPPANASREVRFLPQHMRQKPDGAKTVGTTRLTDPELIDRGEKLIKAFGSYHKVFWNCQNFAKLYLRIITEEIDANFDDWTFADTSRMFMCAIIVTSPFATTNKVIERKKTRDLLKEFPLIGHDGREQSILEASDRAISLALSVATDEVQGTSSPQVMQEPRRTWGFLGRFMDWLMGYST